MKGDFCRMCGSKKLRHEEREIYLAHLKKTISNISVWVCENCGEEYLDDSSRNKLYSSSQISKRKSIAL